ncbi:beta-propeller fold lactonase family protein [Candidatus Woesearchaeota archaeon]|nr:beta-propeller fold lactonase family protein [Candidatus Woesearchaeota archaeon]
MKCKRICILFFVFVLAAVLSCSQEDSGKKIAKIYVANEGDGTISVVDAQSLKVVKTIKLEGMPHNVNVDPLGRYVYATNHEGEEEEQHDIHANHVPYLRIIDAKNLKIVHSIPMQEIAAHVVPSRDGRFVFVSREGGSTIVEVDIEAEKITKIFKVGEGPHGFVLSNNEKTIYSPNMRTNDVSIVDIETGNEERLEVTFDSHKCNTPVAMGITQDDKFSFVTCGKSFEIYKIDNENKKVIGRVGFKKGDLVGPIQAPVYRGSNFLYVPDMRNSVVHKIAIEKFELEKDIPAGQGAHGIAYSSDGKTAYVTNTWENTLSILDLASDSVIKSIKVGSKPNGVAVSDGYNQGW